MAVTLYILGGSPNYTAKTSVGFIIIVICELIRFAISSSLGVYFLPENLARERGNAGAFSLLWYAFSVSLVLGAFSATHSAGVSGIIFGVIPTCRFTRHSVISTRPGGLFQYWAMW